ncbi:MAG TPA: rod shape-determining protein, partial [Clostridia bacterium]|nr:rod shape-determining protein [Clostridia bacterium]
GNRTAENIKIQIGTLYPSDYSDEMEIRGRNMTQGLPVNLTITSDEIAEAMEDIGNELLEAVRSTLERTPPELAADVMVNGIYLSGGGALIRGIDKFISTRTGNIPVYIAENPLDCVAIGTGKALENIDYLSGATRK